MNTLKQIMRGMMNCYSEFKIGGTPDYSFFRPNTIRKFAADLDEGYFAEGIDGVGYIFICGTNRFPSDWADWVSDFDAAYNCTDRKIQCHRGFRRGFESIKDSVEFLKGYKTKCIAGHSRGGAIATLMARHTLWHCQHKWGEKDSTVYCITAGSPAVYNAEGAKEFDSTDIISIRMKYRADAVTYFPTWMTHVHGLMQLGGTWPIPWPLDHYPVNYYNALA